MGIAGLWASKRLESGEEVLSFTMLTVNADDHELFKHFHKPGDERRMVVILHEHQYDEWLKAPAAKSMEFMRQYPAHLLFSTPDPDRGKKNR
jgi:putative SOS response-associated peptidase YedK